MILVAPDKFKATLAAARVAEHLITGLRRARPELRCAALPVADGGEGTVDAAVAAGFRRETRTVPGPTGDPVRASFAVRGNSAVVELAQASGLGLTEPAPLVASTEGTGVLIREAVALGCRRVVLGLGGSASTDGGAGMARALGLRLLDVRGRELGPGGAQLGFLDRLDSTGWELGDVDVVIASDVDNPLLGPSGAAAVFGPQKGADAEQVAILEAGLARWAEVVTGTPDEVRGVPASVAAAGSPGGGWLAERAGAGAAGGVGFGAMALLGARLEPGIRFLIDLLGFDDLVREATLVITGEGSLDAQSLGGKAPVGVAAAAGKHNVPVIAVAGRCTLSAEQLRTAGISAVYTLTDVEPDPQRCLTTPAPLLEHLAERIAHEC